MTHEGHLPAQPLTCKMELIHNIAKDVDIAVHIREHCQHTLLLDQNLLEAIFF